MDGLDDPPGRNETAVGGVIGWLAAVVEIVKAVMWPVAAVIIACVFKADVRGLLPRLRRVGPGGVELDPADAQKSAVVEATTTEPGKLKEFPGMMRTPAIERVEHLLLASFAKTNVKPEEREAFLLRLLAQSQLEAAFERIYRLIFGTQISGLRWLNERGHITVDEAREFFKPFEAQNPDYYKDYGFDGWLRFLISNELVARNGDVIEIADLGRDFLMYLTARRLPENKQG